MITKAKIINASITSMKLTQLTFLVVVRMIKIYSQQFLNTKYHIITMLRSSKVILLLMTENLYSLDLHYHISPPIYFWQPPFFQGTLFLYVICVEFLS